MLNYFTFLHWGTNSSLPDYINERIRTTNMLGLVVGLFNIPFIILTYLQFPDLLWLATLFLVCSWATVLINKMGYYEFARFIFSASLITNFSVFHAYLHPAGSPMIASLWGMQIIFCTAPLLVYDVREPKKQIGYLLYSILISCTLPLYSGAFEMEADITDLTHGAGSHLYIWITGAAFVVVFYTIFQQYLGFINKNEKLLQNMQLQNEQLSQSQLKLNDYIKEVENAHEEEKKRKWASDGLAELATLVRNNASSSSDFFDKIASFMTKYLQANQSAIFVVDELQGKTVLELKACYAYDRKKFLQKTIIPGEGLVGQCYLEGEYTYLSKVPNNYVHITSGLGEATPRALLIAPIKVNDATEGVFEIASFKNFETHQIEFILKACESLASVISNVKINERTKELLEQSQTYAEQMRAQEEEMRQNLEELMATQEEMQRKEIELHAQAELLGLIVDNIPFPVFIKDEKGCYTLVNKAECDIFGVPKSEIIGFDDSKFIFDNEEMKRIRASDKKIVTENIPVHFPEQTLQLENGVIKVFKTSKIPFYNQITKQTNILGVSVDLSDTKNLERELKSEIEKLKSMLESALTNS